MSMTPNATDTSETETSETTAESSPPADDPGRSRWTLMVGLLGIAILGAGLWPMAGEFGLIAAAVIALCWYRLSEFYAVALGHAVLLWPVSTETLSGLIVRPEFLIAELGLLVALIAPAMDADAPGSLIVTTIAALCALLAISAGSYWWSSELWIAAAVLMGALVGGGYALYRYELVRLDLVDDGHTT